MYSIDMLKEIDPEIGLACENELSRQANNIELIASENIVSKGVLAAAGSLLTNKYADGYPDARDYGGCKYVDVVENLARNRACELFGAEYANVQPYSGVGANLAVFFALLNPGDTILSMDRSVGGHVSHGGSVNVSGKYFNVCTYGLDPETELLDYDAVYEKALECKPKLILAGASAYPRVIDFKRFREIADEIGAYFMADIAHIAGLIAAELHPSPVPYADIVTTTTHKTLRGPRGGMILCKEKYADAIDKAIYPGTQGGPLEHIIAAKAVAFGEAMKPEFKEYQKKILANAKALSDALINQGFHLVTGGTDNHLMNVSLVGTGVTGIELQNKLEEAHITLNNIPVPNDPLYPSSTSGVRIGTPAVTSRGMGPDEMKLIAKWIRDIVDDFEGNKDRVSTEVMALCEKFPMGYGM